ncbi:succinyltransferase-like protein [Oceanihabitans sediminis]|uniref:Acetyltransferase n=1 Tax=Oceanihabitans sediminis TaxID=1812012 RepID=A0A368P8I9_9FLAO|nr:acyltransferase [Oceanihabitans sediminis]RBP27063.1 succinyltransferase-like protein [Oceanihabitans sediminis]RCU58620.1 acyltransferase [Oceanihabitans sediminis]
MSRTSKIKSKIENLKLRWARTSPERYIKFLRSKGIKIGDNIWMSADVKSVSIDITRPSLIEIGNNVRLNKNLTILTHDGGYYVLLNKYKEFISQSGRVKIGNNVYFGRNCSVFKNVTIGDNVIIGNGSIVTKSIPSNSVAVGAPAKVVGTVEDYYKKRKSLQVEEALDYARSIKERYNRRPRIEDFWEEFPLFINGGEDCPELNIKSQLGPAYENFIKNNKAVFNGFDDFLKAAGIE